jgi:hypothetical protein
MSWLRNSAKTIHVVIVQIGTKNYFVLFNMARFPQINSIEYRIIAVHRYLITVQPSIIAIKNKT